MKLASRPGNQCADTGGSKAQEWIGSPVPTQSGYGDDYDRGIGSGDRAFVIVNLNDRHYEPKNDQSRDHDG